MKRADPDARGGGPDLALDPRAHLPRRTVREREREYRVGRHPLLEQSRDPRGQHASLAAPSAGDHEECARPVLDGTALRALRCRVAFKRVGAFGKRPR